MCPRKPDIENGADPIGELPAVIDTFTIEHGMYQMPLHPDYSDELVEKIFAYVDREFGRDAPLSPEDEAMVRELLRTDPAARKLAGEFREVDKCLDEMFQAGDAIPISEDLVRLIRAHGEKADDIE